jgi:hypothetical protein
MTPAADDWSTITRRGVLPPIAQGSESLEQRITLDLALLRPRHTLPSATEAKLFGRRLISAWHDGERSRG